MNTHKRLLSWLEAAKMSQAEFARRCGHDRHNFNRMICNEMQPTLALAVAIERETSGVIPVADWVGSIAA
jgi:hypothetical protein